MAIDFYKERIEPHLERIPKLRRQGYTEEQIAKIIGISHSALKKYKETNKALKTALEKGTSELVEDLEASLYKIAMGYDVEEVKTFITIDSSGKETKRVEKITKHIAPNVAALIFALKNKSNGKWRDKNEVDLSGKIENQIVVTDSEVLNAKQEIEELKKQLGIINDGKAK